MATQSLDLQIFYGMIRHDDITIPARPQSSNGVVLCAAGQTEEIIRTFDVPIDYVASPVLKVKYKMSSANSGTIKLGAKIVAVTPGDSQIVDAKAYDTINNAQETVPGTAGHMKELSIPLTNIDSWAAEDYVKMLLLRDHTVVGNASGDLEMMIARLTYSDT
jgi:hypothetical protein